MMVRQSGSTFSNISIDYLVKKNFNIFIEYNEQELEWMASRDDLYLYASDPLRLVALYLIRDDWAVEKQVPNYYKELVYENKTEPFYLKEALVRKLKNEAESSDEK